MGKNHFSGCRLLLLSILVGLSTTACHHKTAHDAASDPDASVPPSIKPTTASQYLIGQYQLPRHLRATSSNLTRKTLDAKGKVHMLPTAPLLGKSSTPPDSDTPHSSASPTPTSTVHPRTQPTADSNSEPLFINPAECEWADRETPFKGPYASENWITKGPEQDLAHKTLFQVIITDHAVDLEWVDDALRKCSNFQIHRTDAKQTVDRTYSTATINGKKTIVENTTIANSSHGTDPDHSITLTFTRRMITTLPHHNVSIQVMSTLNHPFTDNDRKDLDVVLSRQIGNIPIK